MKEEDKIKLKIEKLKDEKENIKFDHSAYSNAWFAILFFLATAAITITSELKGISEKIVALVVFLVLILVCYWGFNYAIQWRVKQLGDKAKEIKKLYNRLLNK
ncbi:MAG: hypothetical protein U9Q92_05705 [archaeon]|nr:hypothetical protein [archaeon]